MKNLFLLVTTALFLYICTILNEVKASCWSNDYSLKTSGPGYSCLSADIDTSGNPASCGDGCSYTYNDGTVIITATQNYGNAHYNSTLFAKSHWENDTFSDKNGDSITIDKFVIDGFSSFGIDSFLHSQVNIEGKNGNLILDGVSWNAFDGDTLLGNVVWHGNYYGGLNGSKISGNLIIDDTATISRAGQSFELLSEGRIFCKTDLEKCRTLLTSANAKNEIIEAIEIFPEGCETLRVNATCSKCKNENFRLNDGECDRLRYTPAEAAKVLHDDNTNSITITFKK